jgi:hypothetical protein
MPTNPITELITALNRREDTKAIPIFSGNATEQYISSWLSEAESIATIHNWDETVEKNNFASRFKGPALKWHSQRIKTQANGGTLELPTLSTTNDNTLAATIIQKQQKKIEELQKQLNKINILIGKQPPDFHSK